MTAVADTVGISLGEAIRARRRLLGMTLVGVAAQAGLSHPFLSQLERGLARPSMRSLTAIAAALNTSAQALLAATAAAEDAAVGQVSVVAREASACAVDSPGGTVRPLVRGERAMLPVEYLGAPREFAEYFAHPGEEFVYVVSGTIEADIEGEPHVLDAGESLYFSGGLRHRWRDVGESEVRLVVVQQNQ
jgi:transcriptional regulator with XRE-family HTH domain